MAKEAKVKSNSIILRKRGLSLLTISRNLKVSKSSVRNWTKHVILSKNQGSILKRKNIERATKRIKFIQKKRREENNRTRKELERRGIDDLQKMLTHYFLLGWAYTGEKAIKIKLRKWVL